MNSKQIMTNVILASVLEPIPEKKGCTTKTSDWQDKSKFEYFLISGVNIGKVFYDLNERIRHNKYQQPKCIYDLAYKAQLESLKNRNGGKINFGIIELLIPIVTTQVIYKDDSINVLDNVVDILNKTTILDVKYHLKFRKLARSVSKLLPNTINYEVKNLYDYYKIDKGYENFIHQEYINGFRLIKQVYNYLEKNYKDANLLDITVEAYNDILNDCKNYCGLAADYICLAIYFFINKYENCKII